MADIGYLNRNAAENGDFLQDDKISVDSTGNTGASPNSDEPPRKRRRSRKGLEKRFECTAEGCGKSYSRAEHLYRHQLNHSSKQTFCCDFPGCARTFVRGDLLKRHMDRHTAKGSQLNRRDSQASQSTPFLGGNELSSPEAGRSGQSSHIAQYHQTHIQPQHSQNDPPQHYSSSLKTAPMPNDSNDASSFGAFNKDGNYNQAQQSLSGHDVSVTAHASNVHTPAQVHIQSYGQLPPMPHQHPPSAQQHSGIQDAAPAFGHQQSPYSMNLPSSQYSYASGPESRETSQSYPTAATTSDYADSAFPPTSEMMMLGDMAMSGTVPIFGGDGDLSKSPYAGMPEDFMAYLFNSPSTDGKSLTSMGLQGPYNSYGDLQTNPYSAAYAAYAGNGHSGASPFPNNPQHVMAVNNLLEQDVPESTISEEKSQEIFDLIKERFNENDHAPMERKRDSILEGDRNDDNHMLSKRMMQAYIGSYWFHFSDQMPILHKPTFSPGRTPNLLLLAMMAIGAACLDRTHGHKVTKAGAKLSNFLAWHLRWVTFMDVNFRPPAKLWVFQTLILLELYEKMYSTRELHERAHIHHATTITLMRRGRSLIGKSALETPPNPREPVYELQHPPAAGIANTPEQWWNQWIMNESTRRAAFAAFVIDSIHATMFGHSAVMVAHEMRLPLPCDESLWGATSGTEVARIESKLMTQGDKPIPFLEGLKRTLSHHEVRTNSFGRTILMAGLMSVSWHMHQRDLQVNVLGSGVTQALGGRDKWRATLTRAYDSWRAHFDHALDGGGALGKTQRHDATKWNDSDIVFESRTVLHHLAHMAMHADIVDCQMYARAKRLLGRTIGAPEFGGAKRRIKELWAPSARARDAMYYALKFLRSVLVPDEMGPSLSWASGPHQDEPYNARDDVLLNRPWVMYFAALVMWCYSYALEGPCQAFVPPTTPEEKHRHMREYLVKYGGITEPGELRYMRGVNGNTAVLMVLKDAFENTRWELLHEGSNLLQNCIVLNAGGSIV